MAEVSLRVNGRKFVGWKTARVTRGIEAVAGSFDLSVSDRWSETGVSWPILEEDACEVFIGATLVITGYVDRRRLSYGARDHALSVSGRDKTANLVDCSAAVKTHENDFTQQSTIETYDVWEFRNTSALNVAQRVAARFGIPVRVQKGTSLGKPVEKITIDPGDTAFNVIEHACRIAGVLPVSDGHGGLLLTRAGASHASSALVEGVNILAASGDFDASGRFARYVCMGQHKGNDEFAGESASGTKGVAFDSNVKRRARVLIVRPEGNATPEQAKKRAQWEATVRAARGDAVTITVQGWTQGDGAIWPINALVSVKSPKIGVKGTMLITQATYSIDPNGGQITELTLKRPDAFRPEPVVQNSGLWNEIARGV